MFRRVKSFASVTEDLGLKEVIDYLTKGFRLWMVFVLEKKTIYSPVTLTKDGKSVKLKR